MIKTLHAYCLSTTDETMKKVYHAENSSYLQMQNINEDLNAKKIRYASTQGELLRAKDECTKSLGTPESIETVSQLQRTS